MRACRSLRVVIVAGALAASSAACGATSSSQEGGSSRPAESGTGKATAAPSSSTGLPDGVPLAPGARLASSVAPIPNAGDVSGWTAVALTSEGTLVAETAAGLRQSLTGAGWTITVKGSERTGIGISAKSPANDPLRWLNISVTPAVPGGGPAVTYRFAQVSKPISTEGPSGPNRATSGPSRSPSARPTSSGAPTRGRP